MRDIDCLLTEEASEMISKLNKKNRYGITQRGLRDLFNEHKTALTRVAEIEYRLTEINYHTFCGLLADLEYEKAEKWIEEEF